RSPLSTLFPYTTLFRSFLRCVHFCLLNKGNILLLFLPQKKKQKKSSLRIFEILDSTKNEFLQTSNIRMRPLMSIRDNTNTYKIREYYITCGYRSEERRVGKEWRSRWA